jgi:hypothetical protein
VFGWIAQRYRCKTRKYWIKSLGAILLGVGLGAMAEEHGLGLPLRYQVSRLVEVLQPRHRARWTTMLLIEDDEFWRGALARRSPLRRDYLARLVRTVARCEPSVIALDFDLRAPVAGGDLRDRYGTLRDNRDYTAETAELAAAVQEVSRKSPLVLPVTLDADRRVEPGVLDAVPDAAGSIVRGNLELPADYRQVPTLEATGSRQTLSFALAAAGIVNRRLLTERHPGERPYAMTFVAPGDFPRLSYRDDARFPSPGECRQMWHKVVVAAPAWRTRAYRSGREIDARDHTPMGPAVNAAYLHANYIEALLEERARGLVPTPVAFAMEVASSALIALLLADPAAGRRRLSRYGAAFGIALALLLLTYVCAQNLGLYADFFFAAIFVCLHAAWDDWHELNEDQKRLAATALDLAACRAEVERLRRQLPAARRD